MMKRAAFALALATFGASGPGAHAATFGNQCDAAIANGSPFVATFGGASPKLVFVAAHHTNDPASDTFAAVRAAAAAQSYALLIVEGQPMAAGPDEPQLLPPGQPDNEARLAARLALAAGIPYLGGEPEEPRIIRRLLAEGWTPQDALGALTLRFLSSRVRQPDYPADRIMADAQASIARSRAQIPELASPDFDFAAWYQTSYGEPIGKTRAFIDRGSSCAEGPTAKFLGALTRARDEYLLKILLRAKTSARPYLVVYGGGHYASLGPELEQAFGRPTIRRFGR